MRRRTLVFIATVGFVVIAWASPAMAKGPDQVTITGPGLNKPIVVSGYGEPGSGGNLGEIADGSGLFLVMFGSDGSSRRVVSQAPTDQLGPRFQLSFRVPDGTESGSTVRQDLYPQAAAGPVTYTEPGQAVFGTTTSGGWYQTPASFGRVLEQLGVSTNAVGQAQPATAATAQRGTPPAPATPGLPVAAASSLRSSLRSSYSSASCSVGGGARPGDRLMSSAGSSQLAGAMFWLKRKTLDGSYLLLSAASRAYFRSPYATSVSGAGSSDMKLT